MREKYDHLDQTQLTELKDLVWEFRDRFSEDEEYGWSLSMTEISAPVSMMVAGR